MWGAGGIPQHSYTQRNNSSLNDTTIPNEARAKFPACAHFKHRGGLTAGVLFFVYVTTVCLGGYCFHLLEYPRERIERARMHAIQVAFLKTHDCVTIGGLNRFVENVVRAVQMGIIPSGVQNMSRYESVDIPLDETVGFDHPAYFRAKTAIAQLAKEELDEEENWSGNWNMDKAIFFSVTVATTIGYGKVSPITPRGKAFCIFFVCVGIPVTLAFAEALVNVCMARVRMWREQFVYRIHTQHNVHNSAMLPTLAFSKDYKDSVQYHEPTGVTAEYSRAQLSLTSTDDPKGKIAHREFQEDDSIHGAKNSRNLPSQRNASVTESNLVRRSYCSTTASTNDMNTRKFHAEVADNQTSWSNAETQLCLFGDFHTRDGERTSLSGLTLARRHSCPHLGSSTQRSIVLGVRFQEEKHNCYPCKRNPSLVTLDDEVHHIQMSAATNGGTPEQTSVPFNTVKQIHSDLSDNRLAGITKQYSQEIHSNLRSRGATSPLFRQFSEATNMDFFDTHDQSIRTTSSEITVPRTFCLELATFLLAKFDCGVTTGISKRPSRVERDQKCRFRIRLLYSCLMFLLILMATIILPSVIFHLTETGWSLLDAVYFCVISMSSVGLGDLVPSGYETLGESRSATLLYLKRIFTVVTTVYLLLGTTLILLGVRIFEDAFRPEWNNFPGQRLLSRNNSIEVFDPGTDYEWRHSSVIFEQTDFVDKGRRSTDVRDTTKGFVLQTGNK